MKGNREQLVITEIPFNVNRAALEQQIAELVNEKVITEISAMRTSLMRTRRLVLELGGMPIPKSSSTTSSSTRSWRSFQRQRAGD